MVMKLGSFITPPETYEAAVGQQFVPASAIDANLLPIIADSTLYTTMDSTAGGGVDAGLAHDASARASAIPVDGARGFGSVFSYVTSKWALACVAMAIILNRTYIYAATRRRLRFRWTIRLLLRFLPITLISIQALRLLQSIQCQTSPNFAELRWHDPNKSADLMFWHPNRFLNSLAATVLRSTDEQSCRAVSMIRPDEDGSNIHLRGSLSRLWPLFGTFCLSHFVETLSCAVQGRPHAYETAMTLFEQSLAFAEADTAVSSQLSWGKFNKPSSPSGGPASVSGTAIALTRSMILKRANTPPEVLLVALLSSLTHISSHTLGLFDLQARYRLINTGFWAFCFMATLVYSAVSFDLEDPSSQGLLRFPTVCIIGLIPHILVFLGILACLAIYAIGLLLSALSPPAGEQRSTMTFRERLIHAHQNMQANVSFSEIRVTREMDIYTALLRTGFAAVTMASEAVYLNEDSGVNLKHRTWLEESRLQEAEELQRQWLGSGLTSSRYDQIGAIGLVPVQKGSNATANGYSRERAAQKVAKGRGERASRVGVGASERSVRWMMAVELFVSVNKLFARLGAIFMLWLMGLARIRAKPAWLLRLARRSKDGAGEGAASKKASSSTVRSGRDAPSPRMDALDIEAEIRRSGQQSSEENLDADLYNYWLSGGWWGSNDSSGDYQPSPMDDDWDNTSVISATTTDGLTEDENGWESEEEGQRTPTQRSPRQSRDSTPQMDTPFSMHDLARLLQPKSPEERGDARALAAHFQSDRIMTRSQFRRMEQLQRTRILTNPYSGSHPLTDNAGAVTSRSAKLSPDEEERLLEQLLLSRRQVSAAQQATPNNSWRNGAAGMGNEGPQCVVCQSTPRSIIVWPCRCLSLCDDCRVSLAMNNFDKCVCCRREVISFSRIFVP